MNEAGPLEFVVDLDDVAQLLSRGEVRLENIDCLGGVRLRLHLPAPKLSKEDRSALEVGRIWNKGVLAILARSRG